MIRPERRWHVHEHATGLGACGVRHRRSQIARVDRRVEGIVGCVHAADGILEVVHDQHTDDGAERLLADELIRWGDIGEQRRLQYAIHDLAAGQEFRALLESGRDRPRQAIGLTGRDERTDHGRIETRVAVGNGTHPLGELGEERFRDPPGDVDPLQ